MWYNGYRTADKPIDKEDRIWDMRNCRNWSAYMTDVKIAHIGQAQNAMEIYP